MLYVCGMIRSFASNESRSLFQRQRCKRLPTDVQRIAYRKLMMLHAATDISDLRVPPGNRLEALKGDRRGKHSIRINDQWRICFMWRGGNAEDVEIVDYH